MALILNIETATTVCSVAVSLNGRLLSLKEENRGFTHAENITLFIEHALQESGKQLADLDAVAVSSGPGSYTGLRIGVSTAKGLCYALEKPLISIRTLSSMANYFRDSFQVDGDVLLCPMIDARRMEVYCGVFDMHTRVIEDVSAKVIDENSFGEHLIEKKIFFFGDGAGKCRAVLSHHPNALFGNELLASASGMLSLAEEKFHTGGFENTSLFEPFYLKEFRSTGGYQ